jgi:CRP/FNR family cyclic AMP-dependent transcriptional regulator
MSRHDDIRKATDVLLAAPYFVGLDAATLKAVAQATIRRDYEAGQVVFLEGEPCTGLYVIQDGWLKAVKISPAGREQILQVVGPGEVFNAIGVFVESPNPATVVALEPATVWIVRRETMLQLLDEYPDLARVIIQNLAGRVLHLVTMVEDLSLRPVETRLARLLLEQSEGEVLQRRRWTTQAEMAARLGTVPDVLNRALRSLVEKDLIEVERHQIRILDRQGLEVKAMLSE